MEQSARIWQLLGTFLPLYGIVLTAVAAAVLRGRLRLAALVGIPLFTLWVCTLFGERIAYDGNMLYVSLVLVYVVLLCIYYPGLLIVWALRQWKRRVGP